MKNHLRGILTIIPAAFFALSCSQDGTEPAPEPSAGAYSEGVIVINGGNFGQNNGTFSFLKRDEGTVVQNIFNLVNGQVALPPEDGRIEGYAEAGETGIILFDHSAVSEEDRLVFVDASTFEKKSELTAPGIENPRDVVVISETKAYVTNWDALNADYSYKDGYILVINPKTREAGKKITIGPGAENMVLHQNKVYVGRAWTGNELTVVSTNTDEVVKTLSFESWPQPVGIDASGKLWVKEGNRFHRINTSTDAVEATVTAGDDAARSIGVAALTADKANIIFVLSRSDESTNFVEVGSTYLFKTSSETVSVDTPVVDRVFSALAADPVSKEVYAGVTPNFSQAGYVLRLSAAGVLQDSVKVEISPEGFFFK